MQLTGEAIPSSWDGGDKPRGILAQPFSQSRDLYLETVVLGDGARPDAPHQSVFCYQATALLD
ncbi:MAG: hypothetical protein QOG73_3038 [Acetobacteraceae bacterium]|nr:hypothetical protein [Acetobacteraceae bacterium]MEA2790632.1 hypothetical protein [Acetobacteraceae bacterium]